RRRGWRRHWWCRHNLQWHDGQQNRAAPSASPFRLALGDDEGFANGCFDFQFEPMRDEPGSVVAGPQLGPLIELGVLGSDVESEASRILVTQMRTNDNLLSYIFEFDFPLWVTIDSPFQPHQRDLAADLQRRLLPVDCG